ncbi:MAG: hypothetical protein J5777_02920 [Clostridiales bacterium]|nr:hypothetical protein [Clostridiales bacterium]
MNLKRITAVVLLALYAICLSSCSSAGGFTRAGVVKVAKTHGMAAVESNGDVRSLMSILDSSKVSSYYVSKNMTDAQSIYDLYLNADGDYPICDVNDVVILRTVDKRLKENDDGANINEDIGVLIFVSLNSEISAEKLYESLVKALLTDKTPVRGKKNGYSYAVSSSYIDNGKDKTGIYLKGKNIITIEGFSFGKGDYFGDYVFRELGILDPGEV